MRASIHPEYQLLKVTCSCGNSFETRSTLPGGALSVEVCSSCHPFYTGQQKSAASGGRVQRFRDRYKLTQPVDKKPAQDATDSAQG